MSVLTLDCLTSISGAFDTPQQSWGATVCLAPKAGNQFSVVYRGEIQQSDGRGTGYVANPIAVVTKLTGRFTRPVETSTIPLLSFSMGLANSITSNNLVPADLFTPGESGITFFRYPAFVRSPSTDNLLCFCTGFTDTNGLQGAYVVHKKSTDNGLTWGEPTIDHINNNPGTGGVAMDDPRPVYDANGRLHLLYNVGGAGSNSFALTFIRHKYSDNDGQTWSVEEDISDSVRGASLVKTGPITAITNNGAGFVRISGVSGLFNGSYISISGTTGLTGLNSIFLASGVASTTQTTCDIQWGFSGTPTGGTWTALYSYMALGLGHGVKLRSGRLVVTAYHRYSPDETDIPFAHVIYSDDNGVTWRCGGSLDESVAINQNGIEPSLVELDTNNSLYMTLRDKQSSPGFRKHCYSTNGGLTWSNAVKDDGNNGTTAISENSGQGCMGQVIKVKNGLYALSQPNAPNDRAWATVWLSRNLGTSSAASEATWTSSRVVFYGISWYSEMIPLDTNGNILLAYERGFNNSAGVQYVGLARLNTDWVDAGSSQNYFDWFCNDDIVGNPARTLLDTGGHDGRLFTASGLLGYPSYVTSGVQLVDHAIKATKVDYIFEGFGDFTFETQLATNSANATIFGDNPSTSTTTAAGWAMEISGGKPKVSIADGATRSEIVGGTSINDGLMHTVHFVRDKTHNTLNLYVDRNQDANPVASTVQSSTRNAKDKKIGQWGDTGTNQLVGTIRRIRQTKRALSQSELIQANPTVLPSRVLRVDPPATNPVSLFGNSLKLYWPSYNMQEAMYNNVNFYETNQSPLQPWNSFHAFQEPRGGYFVDTNNAQTTLHPLYRSDSTAGAHTQYLPNPISNNLGVLPFWVVRGTTGTNATNLDFVQNSGLWTYSEFVSFDDAGAAFARQYLINNNRGSSAFNGFYVCMVRASLKPEVFVTRGGSGVTSLSASAISLGTWYHLAAVSDGSHINYYITPVGAVGTPVVSVAGGAATYPGGSGANGVYKSTDPLYLGASNAAGNFKGRRKNLCLFDRTLTVSEIQALYDYRA